jgi:hypothetical protein
MINPLAIMSSQLGRQAAALIGLGALLQRAGVQPGGVLFGAVMGFGAGNIARDYGFNTVETMESIKEGSGSTGAGTLNIRVQNDSGATVTKTN